MGKYRAMQKEIDKRRKIRMRGELVISRENILPPPHRSELLVICEDAKFDYFALNVEFSMGSTHWNQGCFISTPNMG